MTREYRFDNPDDFLDRLRSLVDEGVPRENLDIRMPWYLAEAESLLCRGRGGVRHYSLLGGVFGFGCGMALTVYSVTSWPLITGGKPIVSIPPFLLISYLLVILFGALATFGGFLLLGRLPNVQSLRRDEEFPDDFVIVVEDPEEGAWKR